MPKNWRRQVLIPAMRCCTRRARPACFEEQAWTSDQMGGISALVATPQMKRRCRSFRSERLPGIGADEATAVAAALAAATPAAAARIAASTMAVISIPPGGTEGAGPVVLPPPPPPIPPSPAPLGALLVPPAGPGVPVPGPAPTLAPTLAPTVPGGASSKTCENRSSY